MSTAVEMVSTPIAEILDPGGAMRSRDPFGRVLWLPCTLVVEAPVVHFTVGSLLRLEVGSIVEAAAHHNEDLSLQVNGQLVALTEFEVVGDKLAVRLTEII